MPSFIPFAFSFSRSAFAIETLQPYSLKCFNFPALPHICVKANKVLGLTRIAFGLSNPVGADENLKLESNGSHFCLNGNNNKKKY